MARLKTVLPFLIFAVAVVAIQIITRVTETEYCLTQLTMSLYYTVVVLGLCLVMGFAGQVSLGHGAFFALGAYTTFAFVREPPWASMTALKAA
jgi:branched-chain amino acid transport system permease protein